MALHLSGGAGKKMEVLLSIPIEDGRKMEVILSTPIEMKSGGLISGVSDGTMERVIFPNVAGGAPR